MTHRLFSRRDFLATAAIAAAAARVRGQQGTARATLAIPTSADGPEMPLDFVGLSYEVRQLTDPEDVVEGGDAEGEHAGHRPAVVPLPA